MSDQMWFQRVINASDGFEGFWMCPTPNCDGAGYCFDIFPTDPDHPDNDGWHSFDDDDDEDELPTSEPGEWDPAESKYQELEEYAEPDEDIEGEEWKYGLTPGEEPEESEESKKARERWEDEQKKYDRPDERPRVLDWKDHPRPPKFSGDEDIPF
jgi:hypothetical protein